MGHALAAFRDRGLLITVLALICFPLPSMLGDLLAVAFPGWVSGSPLLGGILEFLDAGAQRELSRSLFRLLLCLACLLGVLLPISHPGGEKAYRGYPVAGLFVLWGLLSVAASPRLYTAEGEWETWALLVLLAVLLRRAPPGGLSQVAVFGLYLTNLAFFLHALWVSVPSSQARVGGPFHHANALSTFLLFCLPFLLWQATGGGRQAFVAALLAGGNVALLIWTGSVTGLSLLTGAMVYLLCPGRALRIVATAVGVTLPLAYNLAGGWVGALGFLLTFTALLAGLTLLYGRARPKVALAFLAALVFACASFTALSPSGGVEGSVLSRKQSAAARLHFYRQGLKMFADKPFLGHAPKGFRRAYPRYQGSVLYFSQYVHSVPLEILVEWGLVGLLLAGASVWYMAKETEGAGPGGSALRWSLVLFFLHTTTGVQSQFPYLLCLPLIAWAVTVAGPPQKRAAQTWVEATGRIALTGALLALFALNSLRVLSSLDREFAVTIHRSLGERGRPAAERLLLSSGGLLPTEGETDLLLAQLYQHGDYRPLARLFARDAISTDPSWAAPRRVELSASSGPRSPELVARALKVDPVNYPVFYQYQAEATALRGGEQEALEMLYRSGERYHPLILNRLPHFRAGDLEEQLVTHWLLVAILEDRAGRAIEAERAFRLALYFTKQRVSRLHALLEYAERSTLQPGPVVSFLLQQIAQQVPAQ